MLLAELNTLTNAAARAEVLDELLRRYLTDDQYAATGLDSAVALLQQVTDAAYLEQRQALETEGGYQPSSRAAYAGGGDQPSGSRRTARGEQADGPAPTTAQRLTTGPGSYYAQVRDLLAPLGSDSAITAALLADSSLRASLWQIATDTMGLRGRAGGAEPVPGLRVPAVVRGHRRAGQRRARARPARPGDTSRRRPSRCARKSRSPSSTPTLRRARCG